MNLGVFLALALIQVFATVSPVSDSGPGNQPDLFIIDDF
jgi:hypothetical protein